MPDINAFRRGLNSAAKSDGTPLDENSQLRERHIINGVPDVVLRTQQNNFNYSPEERAKILKETGDFNSSRYYDFNSEEYTEKEAAREQIRKAQEQGWLAKIGNSLEQLVVGEVLLGTFKGFTDIYDAFVGHVIQGGNNDFTSGASQFFEDLQDRNKEAFKIYRENPYKAFDMGDIGWWADNFVSVGSTLSLLLPSKGITGIVGKLGKLAKADKWVTNGINALAKTERGARAIEQGGTAAKILKHGNYYGRKVNEFADLAGTALLSRVAENYQEARGVYKEGYEKILYKLEHMSPEERAEFDMRNPQFKGVTDNEKIADTLASGAATNTFWADMPLVLMDFIQYKGVESALKGGAKQITTASIERSQRKAIQKLALGEAAEAAVNAETKGFFAKTGSKLLDVGRNIVNHPGRAIENLELSEGFEEGWQGIVQAYNEDLIDSYVNGNHTRKTFDSYLTDGHVWEQAFWGALGGIVFQKAAKGLGKMYQKHEAKKALKKGDITQEQYENIIKSQDEARIAEIEHRAVKLQELVTNLQTIEAGKDPRKAENDSTRNITTANDKERIKNEVIDEWVKDFTLDAVDSGNFDLLAEFINSPEFDKYLQQNPSIENVLGSKSLKSRVQDVYDLYIKNTEALLDNVSGNDIDSIRKAARWMTRNDMTIASEYDNIAKMRDTLSQLNGYIPDSSYEKIRSMDVLFTEYKRMLTTKSELEAALKEHKISKSGYETEKKRVDEYLLSIQKQIVDNGKKLSVDEAVINTLMSNDVNAIGSTINNLRNQYNFAKEWAQTPNQIKEAIDDIIKHEIILNDAINNSPKTQEDFEDIYNSIDIASRNTFNARVNKSIDRIKKYLLNAKDMNEAVAQAMDETFSDVSNPIQRKQLQDAMKVLKVGSHSHTELTKMFNEELEKIKAEREARAKKDSKAIENGQEVTNPVPPSNPNPNTNDSSTGDNQQQNTPAAAEVAEDGKPPVKKDGQTEDTVVGPEEEVIDDSAPEIKALAEQEAAAIRKEEAEGDQTGVKEIGMQFASDLSIRTEEDIKKEIRSVFKTISDRRLSLFSDMIRDGIGSAAYNQFMALALDLITGSGIYLRSEVAPIMDYQLKVYLTGVVSRKEVSPEQKKGIFTLINDIDKIVSKDKVDSNFSKISTISDEEFNKNMEEFLDKYFGLGGKVNFETKNGVKLINLDGLFTRLLELSKAGVYNFEELAEIVNNIYNFINNYNGKKFAFVSNGIFDTKGVSGETINYGYFSNKNTTRAKIDNLSQFINQLYIQQTVEKTVIDDNMHFNISSTATRADLQKAKGKKLKVKYETIGGVKTVSLYYTNEEGKDVEIGFLGAVEQGTKDNKTLKLVNQSGVINSVTKDNGEYHITNKELENLLFEIIDNLESTSNTAITKLAKTLYSQYEFGVNQSHYHELTSEDIDELLSNEAFTKLLELSYIKLPIGTEYTRKNGSKGKTNVKVTTETLRDMNESDKRKYTIKILKDINKIIFYPYYDSYTLNHEVEIKTDALKAGLSNYIKKVYDNYSETLNYQNALDNNKENDINIDLVAADNATFNFEKGVRKDIGRIGIKGSIMQHPFVYVAADGSIVAEGVDKPLSNKAGFRVGGAGILIDTRAGNPMIAMFTESNPLTKEMIDAINAEYTNLMEAYYNATGDGVIDAYNNLYNFFNNLLGQNSLFTGWRINKNDIGFSIFKVDESGKGVPLAEFYKYGASYDYNTKTFSIDGQVIPESELKNHYNHTVHYYKRNKENKLVRYRIKQFGEKEDDKNRKVIKSLFNDLVNGLTYSASAITTDPTKQNGFVNKHDKGITVTIGKFNKTYKNYADFLVQNNAFKTTYAGVRKTNQYTQGSNEASSIYVKYTGAREYISEEEKRRQQGFKVNLEEQEIKDGDEVSANDILLNAGYSPDEIKGFEDVFKVLAPKAVTINYSDKEGAFAESLGDKVHIYQRGITAITANRQEALRILIHENVHQQIASNGFFTSHKYGEVRTDAIIDTWNQFYEASKDNPDLSAFINNFLKEYGNLKTSDKLEDRAKFANEWVAEVMSQASLMEYLNNIEYKGNLEIAQGSNRKTILQKILDVIKDLFTNLQNINKNTILDQFSKAIGNPVINTIKEEINATTNEQQTTPVEEETVETEDEELTFNETDDDSKDKYDEIPDEEYDFGGQDSSSNTPFDWDNFSKIEGTPEEIRIAGYLEDTKNNPYGLTYAPDMDTWLKQIEPHNRPAMVSEMTDGGLEYLCR